jgi:hypothetical protein
VNKRWLALALLALAGVGVLFVLVPRPAPYPDGDAGWTARWTQATGEIGQTPGEGWKAWTSGRARLTTDPAAGPTIPALASALPGPGWPDRITPPGARDTGRPFDAAGAAFDRLALGVRVAAAAEDAERVLELARLARRLESGLGAEDGLPGLARVFAGGAAVDQALQEAVASGLFSGGAGSAADPGAVAELIGLCEEGTLGEVALRLERERSLRRAVEDGLPGRRVRAIDQFFYELDLGWRGRSDAARRAEATARDAQGTEIARYLPDLEAFAAARRAFRAERVGLRVMLALEHHRARNGVYPATLDDLTPLEFTRVPVDPYGFGERFGYRAVDPDGPSPAAGYLLYSVGPDRRDDAGTPMDDAGAGDRLFSPGPSGPAGGEDRP